MKFREGTGLLNGDMQEHIRIFELLIQHSPDVIWMMDPNMRTLFMSPSVERHLGYTVDEYLAIDHEKRLPARSYELLQSIIKEQVAPVFLGERSLPEDPIQFEMLHRHKNGNLVWGEITLSFLHDEAGKVKWIMGITRDIDARKRAQDEVLKSRARIQSIINESSDWIWELDVNDCFTFSNNAVEQILGLSADAILGKRPYDFAYEKTAEQQLAHFFNLKQAAMPLMNFKVTVQHINGTLKHLDVKADPYFNEDSTLQGYRGICRDITSGKAKSRNIELLEKTHSSLIANDDFAWIKLDPDFEILEWNKGAIEMFGFSRSETQVGEVLSKIFPPPQLRLLKKNFSNPENLSGMLKYTGMGLHQDGRKLHCHIVIYPDFDDENNPAGGDLFIFDYTRFKQLLDASAEYDEILSKYCDAYVFTDKFFNITFVNEVSAKWLGRTVNELTGQNIGNFQCQDSLKRIQENGKHVACRKHPWKTAVLINHPDIPKNAILSLFSPTNSKGKQLDFVFIFDEVHQ
ncbi:MAG: PAS domain-containing protein [Lentimicrobium sp.]|jgi:PAS domain S-box-containing protein|nr:PAS domain-containing protein [Lentimicrobiaceae bacterium]MDY0026000.1 PAS domain-containing protein [Lentimicrobium sp.]